MNNGTIEADFKQLKASPEQPKQAPRVVNSDEVTNEVIPIRLSIYKNEPLILDDGTPFCDEHGNQHMGRTVVGTRTAKILNIAPIDLYTRAIAMFDGIEGGVSLNKLSKEQLDSLTDMLLECWRISEPFMTKDALREGVDGIRMIELFTQVFFKGSPQSSDNPSQDGSITQDMGQVPQS
jgi:hypothetical protein